MPFHFYFCLFFRLNRGLIKPVRPRAWRKSLLFLTLLQSRPKTHFKAFWLPTRRLFGGENCFLFLVCPRSGNLIRFLVHFGYEAAKRNLEGFAFLDYLFFEAFHIVMLEVQCRARVFWFLYVARVSNSRWLERFEVLKHLFCWLLGYKINLRLASLDLMGGRFKHIGKPFGGCCSLFVVCRARYALVGQVVVHRHRVLEYFAFLRHCWERRLHGFLFHLCKLGVVACGPYRRKLFGFDRHWRHSRDWRYYQVLTFLSLFAFGMR